MAESAGALDSGYIPSVTISTNKMLILKDFKLTTCRAK